MASSIQGFANMDMGSSVPGETPAGRNHSVANLIDIVEELKNMIMGLDVETMQTFLANFTNVNEHMDNTNIHLDGVTMKNLLIEIINKYQLGELGGGGSTNVIVSNRTNLLASNPGFHGTIGYVLNEGTNWYVWNNATSKWAVKAFNAYEAGSFPSDVDMEIVKGTVLINKTTGESFTWL